MLPPWLRLVVLVLAAMAAVWVLLRLTQWLWRRRGSFRREATDTTWTAPAAEPTIIPVRAASSQPPAAPLEPVVAPAPEPVRPAGLTILKANTDVPTPRETVAASTAAATADRAIIEHSGAETEATGWRPSTWADRPLLNPEKTDGDQLPRLLAEDVPVSRSDDYVFGSATPVLAAFLPESADRVSESRKELQAAGYYQPHAVQNYAALRYVLMMLGLIVAGIALILSPPRFEWIAVLSLLALPVIAWALPRLYVRGRAAERRSEIERGMPDLLDMLNMCVSQGLTVSDAMRRILPDLRAPYPALAQELRIVNEQASIGSMKTALENFGHRIDIPEVHSFASLLTQTEKMGTSISEALASYSDTMRESLRQRADEKGNRATFRLLFPTVLCLMPAVYLFLLGPAIVELSNFFASGGRDSLDQGSAVIQRINESRRPQNP